MIREDTTPPTELLKSVVKKKKIAEKAQTDKDGTVFNPPEEILEMLKDPKNYEISSKMLFKPVETEK